MKGLLSVLLLILTFTPPAYAADFQDGKVALTIESKAIIKGVTAGGNSRGPALAL